MSRRTSTCRIATTMVDAPQSHGALRPVAEGDDDRVVPFDRGRDVADLEDDDLHGDLSGCVSRHGPVQSLDRERSMASRLEFICERLSRPDVAVDSWGGSRIDLLHAAGTEAEAQIRRNAELRTIRNGVATVSGQQSFEPPSNVLMHEDALPIQGATQRFYKVRPVVWDKEGDYRRDRLVDQKIQPPFFRGVRLGI